MLKRLFNENRLDLMLELLSEKKYREFVCEKYINEHPMLSKEIIEDFNFKLIKNKYILKNRNYTEGSYSKKIIKVEEKQFISKLLLFRYFHYQVKQDLLFFDQLKHYTDNEKFITENEYLTIVYIYEQMKITYDDVRLFDIDNQVEITYIWEILKLKGAREQITKYFITNDWQLAEYIIKKNKFERINDKYIRKINNYTNNSYSRNKIKHEEIDFCLKIIALEKWKGTVKDLIEYTDYYKHYFNEEIKLTEEYLLKILNKSLMEAKIKKVNQND